MVVRPVRKTTRWHFRRRKTRPVMVTMQGISFTKHVWNVFEIATFYRRKKVMDETVTEIM